ncbi:hypothetical protein [Aliivibrio sifiae]|uniref:Uncharacterized protein n=1 Tax=Aliivibrio sifiae TaxID=566293 RepID=A0A2S7X1Z5_9GAMM|nr:hypothetical protein [Aliivibrio sifiae]PQJ84203.1 hypothetical protein BTO22_11650 [Aliivibrio sifiae]
MLHNKKFLAVSVCLALVGCKNEKIDISHNDAIPPVIDVKPSTPLEPSIPVIPPLVGLEPSTPFVPDFYNKETLLTNLPVFPCDPVIFAHEPTNSYNDASVTGGDEGSTKKHDLITWYDSIPHSQGGVKNLKKEYDLKKPIYDEVPVWDEGEHYIGLINKEHLENTLSYYNFVRGLSGLSRVYMSGYKQVLAQTAAWSGLSNNHDPKWEEAQEKKISRVMYDYAHKARETSNLWGECPKKDGDYVNATKFSFGGNFGLSFVWNESSHSNISSIGHRNAAMNWGQKDVGISMTHGYAYTWMVYGGEPGFMNGAGLGGDEQSIPYNAYPKGKRPIGLSMYPSHGFYPFFSLNDGHHSTSIVPFKEEVTELVKASVEADKEIISVKVEFFVHATDDTKNLTNPVKTVEMKDIAFTGTGKGGSFGGKDWIDNCGYDKAPLAVCPEGIVDLGGYHFSAEKPIRVRAPLDWYNEMKAAFNDQSKTPNYYTIRYTFDSKKPDGSNGDSLRVIKPFFMNPIVGEGVVAQTTYFDILRHRE